MKWNYELPTEDGLYITCYKGWNDEIKVDQISWVKDEYGNIRPDTNMWERYEFYAWMPLPKWNDDGWNEVPHYTDDIKWRDYCPTEDGDYIVKEIDGWIPHERKTIFVKWFQDGNWRTYPNKPIDPKWTFVYGWMPLPKPSDTTNPIFNYRRAIGINDKLKKHLKEITHHKLIIGDYEYDETFDEEKGFVLSNKRLWCKYKGSGDNNESSTV